MPLSSQQHDLPLRLQPLPGGLEKLLRLLDGRGRGINLDMSIGHVVSFKAFIEGCKEPAVVLGVEYRGFGEVLTVGGMDAGMFAVLQIARTEQRRCGVK